MIKLAITVLILCMAIQNPSRGESLMTKLAITVHTNLDYGERDGTRLTFDHYQPASPNGAAILVVNSGGFESGKLIQYVQTAPSEHQFLGPDELTVEDSGPIPMLAQFSFAGLLAAGFAVFDVRHSNAPHTVDDMLGDIQMAIESIEGRDDEFSIDATRIGIFGASSGGYLALASGLSTRRSGQCLVAAMATYYPAGFDFPADVAAFPQIKDGLPALTVDDAVLHAVSIKSFYQSGGPPTLVIYGDQDFPFIVNSCRSICSEFPKAGIETKCVVIEGVAHEFMRGDAYHTADGARAQQALVEWFQRHLLAASSEESVRRGLPVAD